MNISSPKRTFRRLGQSKSFPETSQNLCNPLMRSPLLIQSQNSPLIGQLNGSPRNVVGLDPKNANGVITFPTQFVVSQGGEYFFSPSIKTLKVSPSFCISRLPG